MVSFSDRPTVHFIPSYRHSACTFLFWGAEDLAEFRRDALLEKAGLTEAMIHEAEQREELERQTRRQVPSYKIRAYNRPEEWLPLHSRPGKIGYAQRIKGVTDV